MPTEFPATKVELRGTIEGPPIETIVDFGKITAIDPAGLLIRKLFRTLWRYSFTSHRGKQRFGHNQIVMSPLRYMPVLQFHKVFFQEFLSNEPFLNLTLARPWSKSDCGQVRVESRRLAARRLVFPSRNLLDIRMTTEMAIAKMDREVANEGPRAQAIVVIPKTTTPHPASLGIRQRWGLVRGRRITRQRCQQKLTHRSGLVSDLDYTIYLIRQ